MSEETTPSDDQINDMLADVHALYIAARAKYEKARAAERKLRKRMQEVYGMREETIIRTDSSGKKTIKSQPQLSGRIDNIDYEPYLTAIKADKARAAEQELRRRVLEMYEVKEGGERDFHIEGK